MPFVLPDKGNRASMDNAGILKWGDGIHRKRIFFFRFYLAPASSSDA
jgi:hypothetical protein